MYLVLCMHVLSMCSRMPPSTPLGCSVHVVFIRPDLADLVDAIRWLRANDKHAQAIAANGAAFIESALNSEAMIQYTAGLLHRYRASFPINDPTLQPHLSLLYKHLCTSHTCSIYNTTHPPPRFSVGYGHGGSKQARTTRPLRPAASRSQEAAVANASGLPAAVKTRPLRPPASRLQQTAVVTNASGLPAAGYLREAKGARRARHTASARASYREPVVHYIEYRSTVQSLAARRPAAVSRSCRVGGSGPLPLVSLMVLTCNRPAFLSLALEAIAAQDYPGPLQAVIVDDGDSPIPRSSLLQALPRQAAPTAALTRLTFVYAWLPRRRSIGFKRNTALAHANGTVILHWDDDDLHPPLQVPPSGRTHE